MYLEGLYKVTIGVDIDGLFFPAPIIFAFNVSTSSHFFTCPSHSPSPVFLFPSPCLLLKFNEICALTNSLNLGKEKVIY